MREYTVNEEGFWEVPEGEGEERKRFSFRVYKNFSLPLEVSQDLRKALNGFGRVGSTDIPAYVLAAFGLYRENYPDEEQFDDAVSKYMWANFRTGLALGDGYCDYHEKTGLTELSDSGFHGPLFARILATILAHHGIDEIYTIEASRLDKEPEYDDENTFGGEAWVVGPNRIATISTDELIPQLVERIKNNLSAQSTPRMGM